MSECGVCIKNCGTNMVIVISMLPMLGADLHALQLDNQRVVRLFVFDKASKDADVLRIFRPRSISYWT